MMDPETEFASPALAREHLDALPGWKRDAQAFRDAVGARATLDIPYGPRPRQRLDVFAPAPGTDTDTRALPVLLFLHGGYWQSMHRLTFSHLARGATAHGLTTVVAGYTLCPEVTLADLVEEARAAVAFTARRFNRPVVVYGHSAGGHLAACMLATDWPAVDPGLDARTVPAVCAISGLFELEALVGTSANTRLRLDDAEARRLSPRWWHYPAGTLFLGATGERESAEFHRQTRELVAHLPTHRVSARAVVYPGESHFTVIAPLTEPQSAITLDLVSLVRQAADTP